MPFRNTPTNVLNILFFPGVQSNKSHKGQQYVYGGQRRNKCMGGRTQNFFAYNM